MCSMKALHALIYLILMRKQAQRCHIISLKVIQVASAELISKLKAVWLQNPLYYTVKDNYN